MLEEVLESLVGVLGRPKPGELPHGPEPASVHAGIDAAGVRELARRSEIAVRRPSLDMVCRIELLDIQAG
jgi:hypothetical protein